MRERMPIEMNGRDCNMKTVPDKVEMTCDSIWDAAHRYKDEPWIWFRLMETRDWSEPDLAKLSKALYMRSYERAYKLFLTFRTSKQDGICFYWTNKMNDPDARAISSEQRRARLDKKLARNKRAIGDKTTARFTKDEVE